MFIASNRSKNKFVHTDKCSTVRRIKKTHRIYFVHFADYIKAGYRLCPHCSLLQRKFQAEKEQLENFCRRYGFNFELKEDILFVSGSFDDWAIIYLGRERLELYHASLKQVAGEEELLPGYHRQHICCSTLLACLESIYDHQSKYDWAQKIKRERKRLHLGLLAEPRVSKTVLSAKRRKEEKYGERIRAIKNVTSLIEQLSANGSVL